MTEKKFASATWSARWWGRGTNALDVQIAINCPSDEFAHDVTNLISAAPDLYDSLSWIESYTRYYPVEECGDEFRLWVEKTRKALAKARGET